MQKLLKRFSITLVLVLVSGWAILFFSPKPVLLEGVNFSRAVYDSNHQLLRMTLSYDDKYRAYTPLKDISPLLIQATLLQEDQYFRWHIGINPVSMVKAGFQTYFYKSRRVGASTLTMQVARMRFNINSKTLRGKLAQIFRALQLEAHYNKNEILEAYLNLAPYGNNIEGVGAASLIYFGKSVNQLTLPEALTLSVIPQNPNQRVPGQKNLKLVRNKLFTRWLKTHPDDKKLQTIVDLPLQMLQVRDLPFVAPQFVEEVLNKAPSNETSIVTTLDLKMQHTLDKITKAYIARKTSIGVNNAAILIIDTRTMGVKASLGSANFFDKSIQGQINGTNIKRSPGSTLKPFIYALAIDQGLIHPSTVLKDVPHSFGSYNPENFDYDFMGPIKAKDALVISRNIPAIYLADQLKNPDLYAFLQQANVSNLKSASYYGLALVLGGAELTMEELTSLYAVFVNDGVWFPLRYRMNEGSEGGKHLLSPEASYLVLDMLKETPRLESTYLLTAHQQIPVAWKTGTSSGYRDAWTFGVFGPYVIGVWIGNFNNQGNAAFVGKNIAAPLMFELIDAINKQFGPLSQIIKNPNAMHLQQVPVCKASGMLPTKYCTETELTWFIPGKSPIKTDNIYREIPIDKKTGLRTCHINQNTHFEIYEFWPSDLLKIFKRAGINRRTPPKFAEDCLTVDNGLEPQIISPQLQVDYVSKTEGSPLVIPLSAMTDADVETLYWFADETYLGKTKPGQTFLWHPKPGKFVIRIADDHGRSDSRVVSIKLL